MSAGQDRQVKEARLTELFCDAALVGLAPHEHTELAQLLVESGRAPKSAEERSYENAAAAVALAAIAFRSEQLPAYLASRIEERALKTTGLAGITPLVKSEVAPASGPSWAQRRASRAPLVMGWLAAAACLLLAIGAYVLRPREVIVTKTVLVPASAPELPSAAPSPKSERAALASRAGSVQVEWSATKEPAASDAHGDVIWNQAEQRGYMRFHGLAKNDPNVSQYQLWIFDRARDAKYPVDGGVFDVDAATGDVIVPIHARVRVSDATLFAITVEQPGGVVVSKREHIVLTAKTS